MHKNGGTAGVICLAVTILIFSVISVSRGAKIVRLESIRIQEKEGRTTISLSRTGDTDYTCFMMDSPPRLIINFLEDNVLTREKETIVVRKGIVENVRCVFRNISGTNCLDYLVIELSRPSLFRTFTEGDCIVVELTPSVASAPKTTLGAGEELTRAKDTKNIDSLEQCLQIAITNSKMLEIARQEIRLAELKVKEGKRGLFPSVVARMDRTDGRIRTLEEDGVDAGFRETEFGLEFGQPIYQGGKLRSTLKQAKLHLEIAKKRYEKAEQELIYEVSKAFYNLLCAQANLNEQEKLLKMAKAILDEAEKKYKLNLITTEEYLNVKSQYSQTYYQKISQEKDYSLALLTLRQLLGLKDPVLLNASVLPGSQEIGINLESCLELASKYRPELAISRVSVNFSLETKKIAQSAHKFKIELAGFYGRGGGAYKTEELKISDSWYAGVRVSKALGAGTLNSGYTADQTNPKLGQSSRTESNTGSVTFSFFDGLKNTTQENEAEIEYRKAVNELEEMEKKVELEVKEAYFNYEKSLIQLNALSKETEYRKEQARIASEKWRLNLAQNSEVLAAQMSLTNALTSYNEALAYHHIAIASLNKAMGVRK